MTSRTNDERNEESDDYRFAPIMEEEEAALVAARQQGESDRQPWPPRLPDHWNTRPDRRFSLRQLMGMMVAASIMMLGFRLLPAGPYALVLGLSVLVGRIILDVRQLEIPLLHLGWWVLSMLYLLAMIVAFMAK